MMLTSRPEESLVNEIVVLRTFTSETEARFAATVLEANGVPARVIADNAGGALPSIAILFPVRLLVRAEDEQIAREILDTPAADPSDLPDHSTPETPER